MLIGPTINSRTRAILAQESRPGLHIRYRAVIYEITCKLNSAESNGKGFFSSGGEQNTDENTRGLRTGGLVLIDPEDSV